MVRVVNVAIPAAALTHVVPPSVAPADPLPLVIARHTPPLNVVATFPMLSCTVTPTDEMAAPATLLVGCVLITRSVGGPGFTVNGLLVPPASPPLVTLNVNAFPTLSIERLVK